jgi:hypothetical protein
VLSADRFDQTTGAIALFDNANVETALREEVSRRQT